MCVSIHRIFRRGPRSQGQRSDQTQNATRPSGARGQEQVRAIVDSDSFPSYDAAIQDLRKEIKKARRDVRHKRASAASPVASQ